MPDFSFTTHAKYMLSERNIPEEWVWRAMANPSRKQKGNDGNMHYTKLIRERDGRILHVVVNPNLDPQLIVTVFFDRRLSK